MSSDICYYELLFDPVSTCVTSHQIKPVTGHVCWDTGVCQTYPVSVLLSELYVDCFCCAIYSQFIDMNVSQDILATVEAIWLLWTQQSCHCFVWIYFHALAVINQVQAQWFLLELHTHTHLGWTHFMHCHLRLSSCPLCPACIKRVQIHTSRHTRRFNFRWHLHLRVLLRVCACVRCLLFSLLFYLWRSVFYTSPKIEPVIVFPPEGWVSL